MDSATGQSISSTGADLARGIGENIPPAQRLSALLISTSERDQAALCSIFRAHSNWRLRSACSGEEAMAILLQDPIPIVICEAGGEWRSLLEILGALPARPKVIVASRDANEVIWAEVLRSGVYDVLPIPWDARQVFRAVSLAWRSWKLGSRIGRDTAGPNGRAPARTAARGGVFED
jgi:DNA-binding NtrC family response regulator